VVIASRRGGVAAAGFWAMSPEGSARNMQVVETMDAQEKELCRMRLARGRSLWRTVGKMSLMMERRLANSSFYRLLSQIVRTRAVKP
jgi:hypothetical protein